MNQNAHTLEQDGLSIRTVWSGESATLVWQGHCDIRVPEPVLNPFFRDLYPTLKGKKLIVDFRSFDYMSSAAHAPILQFLKNLDRHQVPTRVLYNPSLEWQRISYRCMKVLFRAMPQIQFECM